MGSTGRHVVVVGGGIVGASIAYHLAARGAAVTLLEQHLPASGATAASFAWIGRPGVATGPATGLRSVAVDDWHRLERDVTGVDVDWSGALTWGASGRDDGVPWRTGAAVREPELAAPPALVQVRADDGSVDPVAVTGVLLDGARAAGADVRVGTPVTSVVDQDSGTVVGVRTLDGRIAADDVVLANGVGAVALAERLGVTLPVRTDPAIMFRFAARPGVVRGIVAGDGFEARQLADGTVLSPAEHRGETSTDALRARASAVSAVLTEAFPSLGPLGLRRAEIGWRPMPPDGEPVVGAVPGVPGLHVAVMHSAVTLAATVGRLVADEVMTGEPSRELDEVRPRAGR